MSLIRIGKNVLPVLLLLAATSSARAAQGPTTVSDWPLPAYVVTGDAIPASLTSVPGDPAAGRKVIEDRKLGNCLSCHVFPFAADDPGTIGPDLHGIGSLLTVGQLRLRLVNMKRVDPTTIMPAYYRIGGLTAVGKDFAGKPMLTAQQVEDVVAFLASAKTQGAR